MPEVAPTLLVGQAPAGLWDALEGQVLAHGYTVHRGDTGRANGWTDPASRAVRVSSDVDDARAVKTLLHELAHIEAGHVADLPTYATCRGCCEVEVEAESMGSGDVGQVGGGGAAVDAAAAEDRAGCLGDGLGGLPDTGEVSCGPAGDVGEGVATGVQAVHGGHHVGGTRARRRAGSHPTCTLVHCAAATAPSALYK